MKTFALIVIAVPLYWICDKMLAFDFYTSLVVVTLLLLAGQMLDRRSKAIAES